MSPEDASLEFRSWLWVSNLSFCWMLLFIKAFPSLLHAWQVLSPDQPSLLCPVCWSNARWQDTVILNKQVSSLWTFFLSINKGSSAHFYGAGVKLKYEHTFFVMNGTPRKTKWPELLIFPKEFTVWGKTPKNWRHARSDISRCKEEDPTWTWGLEGRLTTFHQEPRKDKEGSRLSSHMEIFSWTELC